MTEQPGLRKALLAENARLKEALQIIATDELAYEKSAIAVRRRDIARLALRAAPAEPETLPRAEYARLKGIEDIAKLIVSGWEHGFPVDDGSGERDLIDRLGAFIESRSE